MVGTGLEVLKRMGDDLTTKFTSRETTLGEVFPLARSSCLTGDVADIDRTSKEWGFPRSSDHGPQGIIIVIFGTNKR